MCVVLLYCSMRQAFDEIKLSQDFLLQQSNLRVACGGWVGMV